MRSIRFLLSMVANCASGKAEMLLRLRHAVLGDDEGDFSLTNFEGRTAEFREVAVELLTLAMFGSRRLVVVDEADEFVSRYREALEDYVARPGRSGILLLDVKSWPATTRLYKAVDAQGLAVDCNAPPVAKLIRWLGDWARQTHKSQLSPGAADTLVELVGPELGLLDQELAKLALMAGNDRKITPEMVQKLVGGWRAKTTWEMLDLALDGNVTEALRQIDRLLASGEVADWAVGPDFRLAPPPGRGHPLDSSVGGRRSPHWHRPRVGAGRRQALCVTEGRASTPPTRPAARQPTLSLASGGRSRSQRR